MKESPGDTLKADIRIKKISQKGKALALKLRAGALWKVPVPWTGWYAAM